LSKILIIGGSGFVGRHILKEAISGNHEIFAIEHKRPLPQYKTVHIVKGGIRAIDRHLLDDLQPDIVFHTARPTIPAFKKAGRILAAYKAKKLNRRLITETKASKQIPKLVFISGSLMYGSSDSASNEDSPLNPVSYARQYFPGEKPVIEAVHKEDFPVTVVRLPWLLGKGSWFEWFYLRPMLSAKAIPLFGKGENLMEIVDILDTAKIISKRVLENKHHGILNLVSAGAVSQLDFATAISEVTGLPIRDYEEVFRKKPEKAAIEAFTSNIVLATKHKEVFEGFLYTPLKDSIERILFEFKDSDLS
jgi:nucleoside-diphosphate-sugar epimerase